MRYSYRVPTQRGAGAINFRGPLTPLAYPARARPSRLPLLRESRPLDTPRLRLLDSLREVIRAKSPRIGDPTTMIRVQALNREPAFARSPASRIVSP